MNELALSIGGMLLTGENRIIQVKACPTGTVSTVYPTWTGLELNTGLCGERLVTHHDLLAWLLVFLLLYH